MGLFSSITSLFTSGGDDARLLKAMELAKGGKAEQALEIYNSILAKSSDDTVRSRALFNRALAHSSMKNDDLATKDLQDVLANPKTPENVQTAARSQLARVKKRSG
jgi:hypothetical protein